MKIVLPKEIRGYHFPRIFTVEMNDFDIERLLPTLFYLVITSGRGRGGRRTSRRNFRPIWTGLHNTRELRDLTTPHLAAC